VAAHHPIAKPWLDDACTFLGCTVDPVKDIQSVVVESSSFNPLGPSAYRLSLSLRNASSIPLAWPHVEVVLLDAQDTVVVRRVVSPAEMQTQAKLLSPLEEVSSQMNFNLEPIARDETAQPNATASPSGRVVGYRVFAFYP
jgi:hypothetical protein